MRQEKKYRKFEVGERVIARDYRGKDPWVAGNISEREGPLMYKVATDKGQIWRRHTEQLKATKWNNLVKHRMLMTVLLYMMVMNNQHRSLKTLIHRNTKYLRQLRVVTLDEKEIHRKDL